MLPNTLNTNEVKDRAGVEQEFERSVNESRKLVFRKIPAVPMSPHTLTISHSETGKGVTTRRRSLVRFDKTVEGDSGEKRQVACYVVLDAPVGDLPDNTVMQDIVANVLGFCSTTGAATTVLFDCTGNGAASLVAGSL